MDEPSGYSEAKIKEITEKYQELADKKNQEQQKSNRTSSMS